MGCDIDVRGRSAVVRGVDHLVCAPVMATDLRASTSLTIAGLAAEGQTEVNRVYHPDHGYERLEEDLRALGADRSEARREGKERGRKCSTRWSTKPEKKNVQNTHIQ